MGLRCRIAPIAGIVALVFLGSDAWSGADAWAAAPADRLREFFEAGNRALVDPATADHPVERLDAVRRLVRDLVDFRAAAERALGDEWTARTPAEREQFVALFTDFVEGAYLGNLAAVVRPDGGAAVTVLDERQREATATVTTAVARRAGGELTIEYVMGRRGARWMVEDVVIDGVSLVDNYRAQMRRVMARGSYAGLVDEMRARSRGGAPPVGAVTPAAAPSVVAMPETAPGAPTSEPPGPPLVAVEGDRRAEGRARVAAPAPSAATPPAIARAVRDAAGYWVQVGAFRSADAVTRLVARLADHPVTVRAAPAAAPVLRVLVGPFAGLAEATAALHALRVRGYRPFIAEDRE